MVQLEIQASQGHGLFTTLLFLNTGFVMMPSVSSHSHRNSNRGLKPRPEKLSTGGFEAQTTKPHVEAYPLHCLHGLVGSLLSLEGGEYACSKQTQTEIKFQVPHCGTAAQKSSTAAPTNKINSQFEMYQRKFRSRKLLSFLMHSRV
jgi:hypothetical protein